MSTLQLILLGRFECLLPSGERISLSMRKAEVLLAYLALAPGLRHPRERLINLLWSDRGEEQARNSLRQCLSAIRKSLGESADLILLVDRTTVCLSPELIDVDAHEFERLAAAGDYESLSTAADLYQGEFLEGISIRDPASQEWIENERGRFGRQFIEILSNLAETQLISHDFGHAIRSAERLVTEDPLGESGWRLLMRSYHESGERSHALQAFKRCQQVLHNELEVDPETATVELRNRIAGGNNRAVPFLVTASNPMTTSASVEAAEKPAPDSTIPADHSIAVLPFENMSGDPKQEYFSDGITASIILSLGLFKGLTVKSQSSSFACKRSGKSSEEIAEALQVNYLVEGSIRKSSTHVRVSVQLIESTSGNQVWGKQYDAELEDILELEQELSQSIAATISGRIGHTLQQSASHKTASNLESYDYLLRGLYHFGKFTAADLEVAKQEIEKCLEIEPDNGTAHTNLGMIYTVEVIEGWARDRDRSDSRARHHIEKALEIEPDNALAHAYMSELQRQLGDFGRSEFHADKAIESNPNASEGYVAKADLLGSCRRVDEALRYADQCLKLDPHSVGAGWVAGDVYSKAGQYQKAIKTFRSISHPPASIHALIATCFVGMDLVDEARKEMEHYLELARQQMSDYPQDERAWRALWQSSTSFQFEEDFSAFFELLLRAGLCDQPAESIGEMPSIAVLPFDNMSGDPEQEHFADGITTDIIATLSRFKHMRTVSRYSVLRYKDQRASIPDIATQQNVRYILEGSVRRSGDRIRVSAELIDSQDEKICWSERYDRELDDLFAVQDEITKHIALAMKVHLDDGDMALHRSIGTNSVRAWELVMAAVDLQDTYIRENIIEARVMAQQAIELDPGYAYAWVCLAWTFWQEVYAGWSESVEAAMAEATSANQHAHKLNPDYSEAWSQAGLIHLMNHEPDEAVAACARAVDLEPGNAEVQALMAFCYIFTGDYERARIHDQQILRLCPKLPNWYYLIHGQIDQFTGNLDSAIDIYRQAVAIEPDSPLCRFYLINALMESGDETGSRALAQEIRALDKAVTGRGLVRSLSMHGNLRDSFQARLEKFDLY